MKSLIILLSFLFCNFVMSAEFVPGEYIVKTSNKSVLKNFKSLSNGIYKVRLSEKEATNLKNKVEYIEPNFIYHAYATVPSTQWGLSAIDVEKAWKVTMGVKSVKVAIIDTGIDCTHPALKNHCDQGWDFVKNQKNGIDDQGHGTHCAGVIAANSTKVMGVAPNVTVLAAKFLDSQGSGTLEGAIAAINYAVEQKATILSNSWGGGGFSQALYDVIAAAKEKGVLFVAAAGNESNDNDAGPSYPASYQLDNIISVAATDKSGSMAYFSNYGANSVHLGAPGVNITSTVPNGGTQSMSGTSMATPHVSGVAALVASQDSNCDYLCIKDKILQSVKPLPSLDGKTSTGGLVNAYNPLK